MVRREDDVGVVGYGLYRDGTGAGSSSLPQAAVGFRGVAAGRAGFVAVSVPLRRSTRSPRGAGVGVPGPGPADGQFRVIRAAQQIQGSCPTTQIAGAEVALASNGGAGAFFNDSGLGGVVELLVSLGEPETAAVLHGVPLAGASVADAIAIPRPAHITEDHRPHPLHCCPDFKTTHPECVA